MINNMYKKSIVIIVNNTVRSIEKYENFLFLSVFEIQLFDCLDS